MKPLFALTVALIAAQISCSPQMPPDQVAAWQPEKPLTGGEMTLYYNTASPRAVLQKSDAITAEILALRDQQPALPAKLPMQKKGPLWQARFTVQPDAQMMLIRFVADKIDDNHGENWESFVYSRDGRTVQGAHMQKSRLLQSGSTSGFTHHTNLSEAETQLEAELTMYPRNIEARAALWDLLLRQYPVESVKARVRNEVRQAYENSANDEEILAAILPFLFRTGQEYGARQIIAESVALLPRGPVAAAARRLEIDHESDPVKKAAMIETYKKDFPQQALPPQF